ncbi:hypothetical protein ACFE04_012378 [Oxalis oulophora]
MVYELTEQKKIGLGLIGFGIFFTFLAVLLFFDRGLLTLGNYLEPLYKQSKLQGISLRRFYAKSIIVVLLVSDYWLAFCLHVLVKRYNRTVPVKLFFYCPVDALTTDIKPFLPSLAREKGTISFLLGLFFIFVRWPVLGIIFEICGCVLLFGGFWPTVTVFLNQIPVVGWIIQYPVMILGRLSSSR